MTEKLHYFKVTSHIPSSACGSQACALAHTNMHTHCIVHMPFTCITHGHLPLDPHIGNFTGMKTSIYYSLTYEVVWEKAVNTSHLL